MKRSGAFFIFFLSTIAFCAWTQAAEPIVDEFKTLKKTDPLAYRQAVTERKEQIKAELRKMKQADPAGFEKFKKEWTAEQITRLKNHGFAKTGSKKMRGTFNG